MTVEQDEKFKAAAHALLLGCALPIFAYNLGAGKRRNKVNATIYTAFLAWECFHIVSHLTSTNKEV
jgi:hypothetical protein